MLQIVPFIIEGIKGNIQCLKELKSDSNILCLKEDWLHGYEINLFGKMSSIMVSITHVLIMVKLIKKITIEEKNAM